MFFLIFQASAIFLHYSFHRNREISLKLLLWTNNNLLVFEV